MLLQLLTILLPLLRMLRISKNAAASTNAAAATKDAVAVLLHPRIQVLQFLNW